MRSTLVSIACTESPPALLNIDDLAARLRLHPRTIWRMRDRGTMPPPFKVGNSVRWHASQIDDWIARGCPPCRREGASR